jgi:hypothetical protein
MGILIVLVFLSIIFLFLAALEVVLALQKNPIFGLILPFFVLIIFGGFGFIIFNRMIIFSLVAIIPFGILILEFGIVRVLRTNKESTIKPRPSNEETRMKINDL